MKETHHHYLRKIMTVLTANMEQPSRLLSPLSFSLLSAFFLNNLLVFNITIYKCVCIFLSLTLWREGKGIKHHIVGWVRSIIRIRVLVLKSFSKRKYIAES